MAKCISITCFVPNLFLKVAAENQAPKRRKRETLKVITKTQPSNFQFITELNISAPLACVHASMPGQVREKAPLQDKVVQCTHSSCIILSSLYKIQWGSYNHSHLTNEKQGIREVNDLPRLTQLERGRGSIQTEDFRLQSSYSFLLNQAASRVKLPPPPITGATRLYHLFIIIKNCVSRTHCLYGTARFHSNTLPESHGSIPCSKKWWCNVLWLWLWKVTVTLLQRMPSQLAAWSLQELSKKKRRRGERQWVVSQDGGLFSLWTCLWLLLKQNPSQVCTLMVLLLGNKSSNPGEKVKLDCTANSSPEVCGNDYRVKWLHH